VNLLKALFRQLTRADSAPPATADRAEVRSRRDTDNAQTLERIESLLREVAPSLDGLLEAFGQAQLLRRNDLALALLKSAAALSPSNFAIHANLGTQQIAAGDLDGALASAQIAAVLAPERAETQYNLGLTHFERGEFVDAEQRFRAAIALAPQFEPAHSSLICLLDRTSGVTPDAMLAQRRQWVVNCIGNLPALPNHNHRDPERVLKVGYVSADFRAHPSAYFLLPLFRHHSPTQIEVHAYSNWPEEDATTNALKQFSKGWRNIHALSDADAAAQITADGMDILVDLSGHSVGHRLGVFARRPAPLQATYMGYLGSSGLPAMDFRISDGWLDPPGMTESAQTENLVRMSRMCVGFLPEPSAPPVSALPALKKGHITFGSLNARSKLNDAVLDLWSRLLLEVPNATLLIAAGSGGDDAVAEALRKRFARAGVAPERIDIRGRQSLAGFFALFAEIDVALDPFPYNGGTTSFHSLWMGVPVITLAGQWPLARCGLMIMENAGLPEFVAHDAQGYVGIARRCADDLPRLAQLREGMRRRFNAAPFADAAGLAHAMDDTYRLMWRRWCTAQSR
jgi:protein O-GlcNAc transferase